MRGFWFNGIVVMNAQAPSPQPSPNGSGSIVTIELPTLLQRFTGGAANVAVDASTVRAALRALFEKHPALRVHILDDAGELRQHVLCFHNGANTRWNESLDRPVKPGDRISIMQAVSGG